MRLDFCKIYVLRNKVNNKIYVGQTWYQYEDRSGSRGEKYANSPYLFASIQKHGFNNFEYETLEICKDQESANNLESEYIIKLNALDPNIGYNTKEGGSNGAHSEETRFKISESIKNKEWSEEAIRAKQAGGAMSKGSIRGPHSQEWKHNTSESMKEWHAVNEHPMQGKHHTEEAKAKIAATSKGRKRSPESVKQGSEKRKMKADREQAIVKAYQDGITIDEIENKFATSRSSIYRVLDRNEIPRSNNFSKWTGKQHSDETKNKMSETRKDFWSNKK